MRPNTKPWIGTCDLRFISPPLLKEGSISPTTWQGLCNAPLKIMKAFNGKDGRCEVPILHSAGGLVGGDKLSLNFHSEKNTRGLISTVAAQKVYGSVGRSKLSPLGNWTKQNVDIYLSDNSDFEWLPQELIMYKGGLYEQNMTVTISSSSSFLSVDLVRLGRTAAKEKLDIGAWRSSLEITRLDQNEKSIEFIDRLELKGDSLKSIHGMNGQPVFGSLVWVMPDFVSNDSVSELLSKSRKDRDNLDGVMTCSALRNGISARYIGSSTQAARFWFYRIWRHTRMLRELSVPDFMRIWPMQESPLS